MKNSSQHIQFLRSIKIAGTAAFIIAFIFTALKSILLPELIIEFPLGQWISNYILTLDVGKGFKTALAQFISEIFEGGGNFL